jgi:hypothetical protein
MHLDEFWAIIQDSRLNFDPALRDGNKEHQIQRLQQALGELPVEEIVEFQRHFDERMNEAYRWDLWAAAYIVEGGCSDDGFSDFRSWLISMGREVFNAALRDPESLVDVADAPGIEDCSFEEFQYVPSQLYEDMMDEDLPETGVSQLEEPLGGAWSEGGHELARRLPRVWAKFGGKHG